MTSDSGRVPQSEIDKANDNIVSAISRHLPLKKTGKSWSARCPFHKERSPSFSVSEDKRMFYCFGCGESGDAVDFLVKHLGVTFRQAVESINGGLTLEANSSAPRQQTARAITCSLPGHAEDREKAAAILARCRVADQHPYLLRNNTAPSNQCLTLKGALIVPIINNIGEAVNVAAITDKGVTFAAGSPSYGSTAILEERRVGGKIGGPHLKIIICADYSHACRIWWAHSGYARVLCAIDHGNFLWMLANCKDRFTHVGCDQSEVDEHMDMGRQTAAVPTDPYARLVVTYGDNQPIQFDSQDAAS